MNEFNNRMAHDSSFLSSLQKERNGVFFFLPVTMILQSSARSLLRQRGSNTSTRAFHLAGNTVKAAFIKTYYHQSIQYLCFEIWLYLIRRLLQYNLKVIFSTSSITTAPLGTPRQGKTFSKAGGKNIVLVDAVRTPFLLSGTNFAKQMPHDLARYALT